MILDLIFETLKYSKLPLYLVAYNLNEIKILYNRKKLQKIIFTFCTVFQVPIKTIKS